MSRFSPVCPICSKSDQVIFLNENNRTYLNKYYCQRCKQIFDAKEGFPDSAPSVYAANPSSISGSEYFVSSGP